MELEDMLGTMLVGNLISALAIAILLILIAIFSRR